MAQPWFKSYRGTVLDPKLALVGGQIRYMWFVLMDLTDDGGAVSMCNGTGYEPEELAMVAAVEPSVVEEALEYFKKRKMISIDDNHVITLMNWEKRQAKSALSTQRVQKHREKKRFSNVSETVSETKIRGDKRRIEEPPYSPPLKGGKKKPSFVKPTALEVQAYLDELGEKRFSGEEFVDGNEAKGWLVGKTRTPMKDWKATVRTWRRFRDADHNGPPRPVDQTDEMTMTFRRLAQKFGCTTEDMKAYWDKEGATPTTKEQVDRFLGVPF